MGSGRLLETKGLTKSFGGLTAVNDLSLCIEKGELVGLIGPNGAGKTTVFNLLTGVHRVSQGRILFCGQDITGHPAPDIAALGIVRTFQATRILSGISVFENVMTGFHCRLRSGLFASVFRKASFRLEEATFRKKAIEIIDMMGLTPWLQVEANEIPQDAQRRLAIAAALATGPQILLLDEPTVGMNPHETAEMIRLISAIRDRGTTILLIEHDMKVVMGICEKIMVLNYGRMIAVGSPDEIRSNQTVIEAYLGSEDDAESE
jgi:branched-chain amino acid transport system ATP-binding protein